MAPTMAWLGAAACALATALTGTSVAGAPTNIEWVLGNAQSISINRFTEKFAHDSKLGALNKHFRVTLVTEPKDISYPLSFNPL